MSKTILRVFAMIVVGFVSGVIGLIIGALIGGNYAEQFVFNGVRGYEATGQVGLIFGALIGLISSWWFLFKRNS
jgi:hypothetical protein